MYKSDSYSKNDLRIIKTHKLLCDSLLALMKESSFEAIHVKDICDRAMVHRSTFYAHFEDKYHLLTYGLQNIIQPLTSDKFNSCNLDEAEEITFGVFEHVASNYSLYSEILLNEENHNIRNILHNQIANDIKDTLKQTIDNNSEGNIPFTIVSQFYAGAIVSLISWWLENNMSIPTEQIARQLNELLVAKNVYFKDNSTQP